MVYLSETLHNVNNPNSKSKQQKVSANSSGTGLAPLNLFKIPHSPNTEIEFMSCDANLYPSLVSPPGSASSHIDFDKLSNHLSLFNHSENQVQAAGSAYQSKTPTKSK